MKRPNLRIIGTEEGEVPLQTTKITFNKIIEEKYSNLKKDIPTKEQEA